MLLKDIAAVNAKLMEKVKAGNAAAIAGMYHELADLVTSGSTPLGELCVIERV